MNAYDKLSQRFQQIYHLDHASTFLTWDQMVMMPSDGNEARSASIAEISTLRHSLLTAPEVADWLTEADANDAVQPKASLREMRRRWQQSSCLPADLVRASVLAGSRCEHGWRSQRADNDWAGFLANFREVVKLSREEADLRAEAGNPADGVRFDSPYDAMLDLHCAGDSRKMIDSVFDRLRSVLPDLLQQVVEKQASRKTVSLQGEYPIAQQKNSSEALMAALGFKFSAGRLDVSMHPFSTGVPSDLRITTRYRENEFAEALLATAHETGHASYEGGLPPETLGLPVGESRNMCIHESQSLLFEKQIFLSRAFTDYFVTSLQQQMPATSKFDAQSLWNEYTRVEPGYIRVEADEVCYPLHVMLRYEIESALINRDIEADVIPEMWNERMQSYLGLSTEDNYTDGCLQDIHWTDGGFGYFPSYTIGAVNAAQIFATVKDRFPDWQDRFREGDTAVVRSWLDENIWKQGCKLESQELMHAATGEGTSPEHFINHLKKRYLEELY